MTDDPPEPPGSLPNYLADGLPKQDPETLRATKGWIDELIEWQTAPIVDDELPDDAETVDEDPDGGGTIVKERVKCGADCECNEGRGHGPYLYRYYRDGGTLKSEYVGKA